MKFTFKTRNPAGRYRAFDKATHDIKFEGKVVGCISDQDFTIRLMVYKEDINEDGNPNCPWKWIRLAKVSKSLSEAKAFLNDNIINIHQKWTLCGQEEK